MFFLWLDIPSGPRFRDHIRTRHTVYESPVRVIGQSQKPLPDNIKHSLETNIHAIRNPWKRGPKDPHIGRRGHWLSTLIGVYS